MRTLEASSSQDVADGVRREGKALRNQQQGQPVRAITGLPSQLLHLGLDLRRRAVPAGVRAAGAIVQASFPFGLVATHPATYDLTTGVPALGHFPDAAGFPVGLDQFLACRQGVHRALCLQFWIMLPVSIDLLGSGVLLIAMPYPF
jgi:hypothetical protein